MDELLKERDYKLEELLQNQDEMNENSYTLHRENVISTVNLHNVYNMVSS